ncbi:MAG TPA: sulfotransferase [Solirubrobacterales bacterium]|nr:sulfotransferase [Solirubrobacterales bacterium]
MDPNRLTWIFGSSRSGSTWLLRMLSDLPGVAGIDDPHLGHHLGVWRPIALAWATAAEEPRLKTLAEAQREAGNDSYFFSERYRDAWAPGLRDLIAARFDAEAADTGPDAGSIVVKEPGSHVAGTLLSLFPQSRLIFLVRDGRDVIDSWLAAYQPDTWAIEQGAFAVAPWGRLPLIRWLASVWVYRIDAVSRAFSQHEPDRRVKIRYEDLRADPEAHLRAACRTGGIDVAEDALRAAVERHDFERVPESARGESQAIRRATSGGWRENLTDVEQQAMHDVMGETLARLGYLEGGRRVPALT